jgi:hypothetical protein
MLSVSEMSLSSTGRGRKMGRIVLADSSDAHQDQAVDGVVAAVAGFAQHQSALCHRAFLMMDMWRGGGSTGSDNKNGLEDDPLQGEQHERRGEANVESLLFHDGDLN